MQPLRWALLILGVLFLVGLAWWELRRGRQARAGELLPRTAPESPQPFDVPVSRETPVARAAPVPIEPAIVLPEIHVGESFSELPVLHVADDSMIGLRMDGQPEEPASSAAEQSEPPIVPPAEEPVRHRGVVEVLNNPERLPDPIVEWPDEAQRRVVALRLVAMGERFQGRAIRQALAAEGFVLGKFHIFHRSGPDGRAVVSAASLTKPGTFDHEAIDLQRYGGLNLFAVLPGPLPAPRAFDELMAAARNLNDRLHGALQDERGEPLTPTRAATIRHTLAAEAQRPASTGSG